MKKLSLIGALMMLVMGCGQNKQNMETSIMDNSYLFLVGTYTESPEDGIHLVQFDPNQNLFHSKIVASGINNPSFLISNAAENLLFAVEETGSERGGKVTSFRMDKAAGTLQKINTVDTHGDSPCHLSLDRSEKFLMVSNYSGGNLAVLPVNKEGKLSEAVQVIQHDGSSVNAERQNGPHVHSAVFHPHEEMLFVANLGTDEIKMYRFDQNSPTPLTAHEPGSYAVEAGAGPRHLIFNSKGNRMYVIHELTGELGVLSYEDGRLSHLATHSLLQEGFEGDVGAAEVRISSDGNFVYASNRGDANDITVFEVDQETGDLSLIQNVSTKGLTPRNFAVTPDGKYLICGNQGSNELKAFGRDHETGHLTETGFSLAVKKPVYILFLNR